MKKSYNLRKMFYKQCDDGAADRRDNRISKLESAVGFLFGCVFGHFLGIFIFGA